MSIRRNGQRSIADRQPYWPDAGFYEPSVDRAAIYHLSRRSRFWPGSDSLAGDEWQYWYGDINVPSELNCRRPRPDCLYNELGLERKILRKLGSTERHPVRHTSRHDVPRPRAGVETLDSALDSAEQALQHADNVRRLRSSSVHKRLSSTHNYHSSETAQTRRHCSVEPQGMLGRFASHSADRDGERPLASFPKQMIRGSCFRTLDKFDDIRRGYDDMLSRMGVTKELTVVHGRRRR